ncbi:unnamed protein product [Rotaria sp. Silwood1]|nr:unnamed protein product [Rotaria sp. Silwood1]CAF4601580.1 unnamed protein product [Rotaria sp. Silwood1]
MNATRLWELDPCEVVSRNVPTTNPINPGALPTQETTAITNAGLTVTQVKNYLTQNNLSLIVSRDVTTRDGHDKQQPFNLRVVDTNGTHPGNYAQTIGTTDKGNANYRIAYSSGQLYLRTDNALTNTPDLFINVSLSANRWYHVAAIVRDTVDGFNTNAKVRELYLDGAVDGDNTGSPFNTTDNSRVNDSFGGDTGMVYSWGLQFNGASAKPNLMTCNITANQGGFWGGSNQPLDTVRYILHRGTAPYDVLDSAIGYTNQFGFATTYLANAINASYYIEIRHRNSLAVRWSGAGGQDFTLNQGTIRVRWSAASFANIRSLSAIGQCVVFTGATNGLGYTSSIRQKTLVGSDSAYVISPLALSTAINSNGWNTSAELTSSGDPDSGFVVTNGYREIAQLKWLVLNTGGSAVITIDNAASGFLTAGRFDNQRNCPSANATNFAAVNLLTDDSQTSNTTPLPIELASFVSTVNRNTVTLNWSTVTEQNNKGFSLERAKSQEGDLTWAEIKFVNGAGNSSNSINYSYEDRNLPTAKYKYRLKQVDYNGNHKYYDLQNEVEVGIPSKFELSQNYPNPFNPTTKINFALPLDSKVLLKVYDITGREISTLLNGELKPAGYYTVDFNGSGFASGLYIYRIQTDKESVTKKMVLVK